MAQAFLRSAKAISFCIILSGALGLAGCGGGGKGSGQPLGQGPGETARGSALVTMYWPEATRLVPAAANCVQISVSKSGGELIGTHNIARPASGFGTVSITFESLPAETVVFTAAAYPNSDATGTPQTRGSVSVQIKPNGSTDVNLTMGTTIARVGITPEDPSVSVGNTVSLAATAYDSEDRIVLTSGTKWQWQLATGSAVGTLTPNADRATFTGTAAGSATVRATETESGKSSSESVAVTSDMIINGYRLRVLPLPTGIAPGSSSIACGINNAGQVVGQVYDHAVVWEANGTVRDLGPGRATDINDAGLIVGRDGDYIVVWQPGKGQERIQAAPYMGIGLVRTNALGQVVGEYNGIEYDWHHQSFVWSSDVGYKWFMYYESPVYCINNSGKVVARKDYEPAGSGYSPTQGDPPIVLWDPSNNAVEDLGFGGRSVYPQDINDEGDIIVNAWSDLVSDLAPYLWRRGAPLLAITPLPSGVMGRAYALNNQCQVVGQSFPHAFMWSPGTGTVDLGTLAGLEWGSIGGSGGYRDASTAYDVNDSGVIVGESFNDGVSSAVIWEPVQ